MRSVTDLERQLIATETIAASAVASLERKLLDAQRMLAAVVLAAGGYIRVGQRDLIYSYDAVLTLDADPETNGVLVSARRNVITD